MALDFNEWELCMEKRSFNILSDMTSCCGCFSCYNICPVGAIYKYQDQKGFYYPKIDFNKCINCRQCVKSCPVADNALINE